MNLNICVTVVIPYSPRHSQLDKVKNICDTTRLTFYCPMCLKSFNKLELDGWDFQEERTQKSETIFMCWKNFDSLPLWGVSQKCISRIKIKFLQKFYQIVRFKIVCWKTKLSPLCHHQFQMKSLIVPKTIVLLSKKCLLNTNLIRQLYLVVNMMLLLRKQLRLT